MFECPKCKSDNINILTETHKGHEVGALCLCEECLTGFEIRKEREVTKMKMYVMVCKEIEVPEKFEALINYEDEDFSNYELHKELCDYVVEKVGLPLAGNAENDTEEWIESVLDEYWHTIVES